MNKLVKGSIAGAAGIALLLGGAGSLAYWNAETTFSAADITAGTLTIANNGSATTTHAAGGAVSLIVPGDVVNVSQPVTIGATGDNLKAALVIDTAGLTGTLANKVTTVVKAYTSANVEVTGLNNLTSAQAVSIAKVVATVTFPTTITGTSGQGENLVLGTLTVKLNQIP
jgi:alternate signal-mediated exported protein